MDVESACRCLSGMIVDRPCQLQPFRPGGSVASADACPRGGEPEDSQPWELSAVQPVPASFASASRSSEFCERFALVRVSLRETSGCVSRTDFCARSKKREDSEPWELSAVQPVPVSFASASRSSEFRFAKRRAGSPEWTSVLGAGRGRILNLGNCLLCSQFL